MKQILLINAHQPYPFAEGKLNKTLFEFICSFLSSKYKLQETIIDNGYKAEEETEKFIKADCIIIQSPIFWFTLGSKFKSYVDEIFQYNIFYNDDDNAKDYGDYGLFKNKKYMFSLTWNAPHSAFDNPANKLFQGRGVENVIFHLHAMMRFAGMTPIKTFSVFDCVKHPDIERYLRELELHLKENFNV